MMNGTAAQQSNSKASTVELAIDYIKNLKRELAACKGKLEAVENCQGTETREKINTDVETKAAA